MHSDGPSGWFSRWGFCLSLNCPDDGDLNYLMETFVAQCEGEVGGPLTNETVPAPLKDWLPKTVTLTGVAPAVTSTSSSTSDSALRSSTTSLISIATATSDNTASVLDGQFSSSSRAASTASSAPATHDASQPSLSLAAIIGVAIGGALLLALIVGLICFLVRRRKRKEPKRSVSPPIYEPAAEKQMYDKPEPDGQAMEHPFSAIGVCAPVLYAELDAGSPVSPVREPVYLSAIQRRARAAQNF
jgi:hypothetical protein